MVLPLRSCADSGMTLAILHSRSLAGLQSQPVRVEADLANGLPQFNLVGLPGTAVRESRERVRAAIQNSGFDFPSRRVTVNLAPADLPKDSGRFDLVIALAILVADGQLAADSTEGCLFAGELSLSGLLLPIRAGFAWALSALRADGVRRLILPLANAGELATLGAEPRILCGDSLRAVVSHLRGGSPLITAQQHACRAPQQPVEPRVAGLTASFEPDAADPGLAWEDILGQAQAKRAALVAAAGQHSLLLLGPPGVGKSMVAHRMGQLLPPLGESEAHELAALQSLEGEPVQTLWRRPPVRSPHHSTTARALVGGGQPLRPGEISLAHHGLLFLDELPEFSREALEALREPLETGEVRLARVQDRLTLPARAMLVAAMNPCPCGYFGVAGARGRCRCTPDQVTRYRHRLSGPLLDRFDMMVSLAMPNPDEAWPLSTAKMRDQVRAVRDCVRSEACRPAGEVAARAPTREALSLLNQAAQREQWSQRVQGRIRGVALTLARLRAVAEGCDQTPEVGLADMAEAISLRRGLGQPAALRQAQAW